MCASIDSIHSSYRTIVISFVKLYKCFEWWNVSEKAAPTNRTAITSMQVQIWYGDRTMADSGLLHWIQSMCGNVLHHSLYEAAMTMALAMAMAMAIPLKINCHKIRHFSCQSSIYELCRILILWHLPTLSSYSQYWWKLMVICVNVWMFYADEHEPRVIFLCQKILSFRHIYHLPADDRLSRWFFFCFTNFHSFLIILNDSFFFVFLSESF